MIGREREIRSERDRKTERKREREREIERLSRKKMFGSSHHLQASLINLISNVVILQDGGLNDDGIHTPHLK